MKLSSRAFLHRKLFPREGTKRELPKVVDHTISIGASIDVNVVPIDHGTVRAPWLWKRWAKAAVSLPRQGLKVERVDSTKVVLGIHGSAPKYKEPVVCLLYNRLMAIAT
jgi:hypothetical protein